MYEPSASIYVSVVEQEQAEVRRFGDGVGMMKCDERWSDVRFCQVLVAVTCLSCMRAALFGWLGRVPFHYINTDTEALNDSMEDRVCLALPSLMIEGVVTKN